MSDPFRSSGLGIPSSVTAAIVTLGFRGHSEGWDVIGFSGSHGLGSWFSHGDGVTYRYDADGLLNTVTGPDGSKIWQLLHRNAFGHTDRVELGEKLHTNRVFDQRTGRV